MTPEELTDEFLSRYELCQGEWRWSRALADRPGLIVMGIYDASQDQGWVWRWRA